MNDQPTDTRTMTDQQAADESAQWCAGFAAAWRQMDASDPHGPLLDRHGRPLADRWR